MRLSTLNLVKQHFSEKINELAGTEDEQTPELINGLITQLEEYDYDTDADGVSELSLIHI